MKMDMQKKLRVPKFEIVNKRDCQTKIDTVSDKTSGRIPPTPSRAAAAVCIHLADGKKVGVWKHKLARLQILTRPWTNIGPAAALECQVLLLRGSADV